MRRPYQRRVLEWCLVATVILVLSGYFLHEFRAVLRNPFLSLAPLPENYAGLLDSAKGKGLQRGTWVFDTYCVCIGYEPVNTQGLNTEDAALTLWFRIGAPPGPLQINALQPYRWAGLPVD